MRRRPSSTPSTTRPGGESGICRSGSRTCSKADCNPLWTATAVPVAHATGARLSREQSSRWRQADAIGIR
ncbi:hypothetical protein C1S70_15065 (plasmid) [Azospirillum argentinense]|uniref:Uncharacterized protein n=1 Tax=Azospirillum argentinense TaxID=2970906 RepID=A0A2K1G067_9PROT|nr:hypothetical protein C1S70_15065 [Azospirillum argentinense]